MKGKLKLIGFEILYLLLVTIASLPANAVQFLGKRKPAEFSQVIYGGIDYKYNPLAYFFGVFIFGSAVYFLYIWILKDRLTKESIKGVAFKIVYVLTSLLLSFIMFIIQCIELTLILGLNDNILPEFGQFVTVFVWPVILFAFPIAGMIITALGKEPEKAEAPKKSSAKKEPGKNTSSKKNTAKPGSSKNSTEKKSAEKKNGTKK